jgi:hypothetical protein
MYATVPLKARASSATKDRNWHRNDQNCIDSSSTGSERGQNTCDEHSNPTDCEFTVTPVWVSIRGQDLQSVLQIVTTTEVAEN